MVENQWTYAKELSKLAAQFFNSTFISNMYFRTPSLAFTLWKDYWKKLDVQRRILLNFLFLLLNQWHFWRALPNNNRDLMKVLKDQTEEEVKLRTAKCFSGCLFYCLSYFPNFPHLSITLQYVNENSEVKIEEQHNQNQTYF